MRIIVTGGRDYADEATIRLALEYLRDRCGGITVIQGGATGADALARAWASGQDGVSVVTVPANWTKYRKSAGPIRNKIMLDQCKPDFVLAFPGGRGTRHMTNIAVQAGVPVARVHGGMQESRMRGRLRNMVENVRGRASGRLVRAATQAVS